MPTYLYKKSKVESAMFWFMVVPALVLLFVALSQPAWRGDEMIAELRSNCDKQGGIVLESKGLLANSYSCVEDWNK